MASPYHYRPDGFHGSITATGATHRFYPPARLNVNVDIESGHATIAPEFFELENFTSPAHILAAITTYRHFFNFARKNRSRGNLTTALRRSISASSCSYPFLSMRPWVKICLDLPRFAESA